MILSRSTRGQNLLMYILILVPMSNLTTPQIPVPDTLLFSVLLTTIAVGIRVY